MRQRIITGVIFTIVVPMFVIPMYWIPLVSILFSLIVGVVAGREMYQACGHGNIKLSKVGLVLAGLISLVAMALTSILGGDILMALSFYLLLEMPLFFVLSLMPSVCSTSHDGFVNGVTTAGTALYVSFPLFCLCSVTIFVPNGWYYMVAALAAPWISDVFAYFTGVLFGKHKIVPHISPKKTWEGCIGGMLFCAIALSLYFAFFVYGTRDFEIQRITFGIVMFVIGLFVSVMSQLGDWLASLIKRHFGIKDFGKFMPGHGGMLDRFDSAFFTLPMAAVMAIVAMYLH